MKKYPRGYTMVEAVVTLFIVAMVLTMSIANYRSAQNSLLLQQTALNLSSALRDAQQHALAGTVADVGATYGYGVHFDEDLTDYTVYADKDDDNDLFFHGDPPDFKFSSQPEPRSSAVNLAIEVVGSCGASTSVVDIAFQPPLPSVSIERNAYFASDCDVACLDLSLGAGSKKTRIKITKLSGLIDIINVTGGCS